MSRDIRDTLKNNTPEFLKTYPALVSFLEAAGTFLNETKAEIEDFDYSHDYKKSSKYALNSRLKSVGFEIPPYISEKVSRTILRDAIQAFLRKGTTDSLLWVLKIIGTTPVIRQAWLPSPNEVRRGKKVNLETGDLERYDVDGFTYTDFLYGDAVTKENGTYFRGFEYEDIFEEEAFEDIPIIGEEYKDTPEYMTPVEKMPYVIVRITDQDFNVATEPYVDPETGEEYEYGLPEEYRAVESLIEYFLYNTARPASVRILLVASAQQIDESIIASESFSQIPEHEPTPEQSTVGYSDPLTDALVGEVTALNVGDPVLAGAKSPYFSQFGVVGEIFDVQDSGVFNIETAETFAPFTYHTTITTFHNKSRVIPVVAGMKVKFRAPSGKSVSIKGLVGFFDDVALGQVIETLNNGEEKTVVIPDEFHGFFLEAAVMNLIDFNIELIYD